jgi:hypothetical protein
VYNDAKTQISGITINYVFLRYYSIANIRKKWNLFINTKKIENNSALFFYKRTKSVSKVLLRHSPLLFIMELIYYFFNTFVFCPLLKVTMYIPFERAGKEYVALPSFLNAENTCVPVML